MGLFKTRRHAVLNKMNIIKRFFTWWDSFEHPSMDPGADAEFHYRLNQIAAHKKKEKDQLRIYLKTLKKPTRQ